VSWLPLVLLLVSADGSGTLVAADAYAAAAAGGWFGNVTTFGSLGHFEEVDPTASFQEALRSVLRAAGLDRGSGVLGVEPPPSRHLVVTGELVTGARTAQVAPGGPVGRQIAIGEGALLDISPRVAGYWADCTNTVVFGAEPTAEQRRYFDAARESCEAAIATL